MRGFLNFIREQGVMGLAVGFTKNLEDTSVWIAGTQVMWGHFVAVLIDFAVIAAIVYFGVHGLGLDKIDKPKENKKDK